VTWYRMLDAAPNGMLALEPCEAKQWNGQGWGVCATVQKFEGARRKENLVRIRAWAIDLDAGDKASQRARVARSPVVPSSIVETKNGYHVYWYARDARPEHYRGLLDRLVAFFGADKNARDLARVLRVPGFLHLKNPADPFLVQHVFGPNRALVYTERQMFAAFPPTEDEARARHREQRTEHGQGDDFWERVYNLDCADGLERLSGMGCVSGERFTFRRCASGSLNILVDGKGTSCWVDSAGRIGSKQNGGPTLYQWLRWYGNSPRECARLLKDLYPHLEDK
jgi:hypothetical protein